MFNFRLLQFLVAGDTSMMTAVSYRYTGGGFGIRHSHGSYELLLVHEGEGELILGGMRFGLTPGMLAFIDAGTEHSCTVTGGAFIRSVVDFSFGDLASVRDDGFAHGVLEALGCLPSPCAVLAPEGLEGMDRRIGLLQGLESEASALSRLHRELAFAELVCEAVRLLSKPTAGPMLTPGDFDDPLVKGALSAMNREMAGWDTGRLAQHLNCGTVNLCRRFKAATGLTITGYLMGIRLHEACRLLKATDLPVSEVGRIVGYPDPPYFTTLFGRRMGMPPNAYRQT